MSAVFTIKNTEFCLHFICTLYMLRQRKAQINWKSVEGAFAKPRLLHLAKGSDGLDHCPVTGCEHVGFASQRGCRKHVKTKHGWYYYRVYQKSLVGNFSLN